MKKRDIIVLIIFGFICCELESLNDYMYLTHAYRAILIIMFSTFSFKKERISTVRLIGKMVSCLLIQTGINYMVEKMFGFNYTFMICLIYLCFWLLLTGLLDYKLKYKISADKNI
ncbi:MAG: hypothetical protein K6G26_04290 [Lachnospiraceae bacterium]|nr:hypothetical protein [Lachnospiraceae bacterium]